MFVHLTFSVQNQELEKKLNSHRRTLGYFICTQTHFLGYLLGVGSFLCDLAAALAKHEHYNDLFIISVNVSTYFCKLPGLGLCLTQRFRSLE